MPARTRYDFRERKFKSSRKDRGRAALVSITTLIANFLDHRSIEIWVKFDRPTRCPFADLSRSSETRELARLPDVYIDIRCSRIFFFFSF